MARVWNDVMRQRINRRRLLQGAGGAALGAASIAVIGCGDGNGGGASTSGTPAADETPTTGGILRLRQTNAFPSLSPVGATALASTLTFGFTTYDHLWYVPIDTGEIDNMLAANVEIVDPEALQINVTLEEAFFHDKEFVNGRQVEAEDVIASWELFRDDPFGLGRDWLRDILESMEAPSTTEFVIRQSRPYAWVFGTSAAGSPASSSVLPRETIDGSTDFDLDTDIAGSGRFFLEGHEGGANVRLRAHPNWRIPGEPFLGGVNLVLLPEFTAAEAQFRAGNIDQLGFQNKLQADRMQDNLGDGMTLTSELSRSYHCLMLKAIPPFDDPMVRRAIRLAIDREEMVQLVERDVAGGVNCSIIPPAQEIYKLPEDDPDVVEYFRHDEDEARTLLEQANFPFDQEFTLLISSPNEELADRAQVLRDQLDRVGIKLRIDAQDLLSVWVPRVLVNGEYELTLFTHLAYEDPYLPMAFYTSFSPIGPITDEGRNSMQFFDEEIDAAVDATSLELELEPRIAKVQEAERLIMAKEGPMINIYSSVSFTGRRSWYRDWTTGRGSFGLFNGRAWIDAAQRGS